MSDLKRVLETQGERFDLAPGALERLFDRRRRKQRNQRIAAGVLALVVAAGGVWGAVSALGRFGEHRQPGSSPPSPIGQSYREIAGTYAVDLSNADPTVEANGMAGRYSMRLLPDGVLLLSVAENFRREGASPSGITYRLSGNQFTTNAFVNFTCPGSIGVYLWQLQGNTLTLTPLHEDCDVRRALFASRPWQMVGS